MLPLNAMLVCREYQKNEERVLKKIENSTSCSNILWLLNVWTLEGFPLTIAIGFPLSNEPRWTEFAHSTLGDIYKS